jgi:hypothetical protein
MVSPNPGGWRTSTPNVSVDVNGRPTAYIPTLRPFEEGCSPRRAARGRVGQLDRHQDMMGRELNAGCNIVRTVE